jgi:hypothetical protein
VLEQALSEAVTMLKEKAIMLRQLAVKANPHSAATGYLIEQAEQDDEHARIIQSRLLRSDSGLHPSMDTTAEVLAEVAKEMRLRPSD